MSKPQYDQELVSKLTKDFYQIFERTLRDTGRLNEDDMFTNRDMATVMMHMGAAYNMFDAKMEEVYEVAFETDKSNPQ